jgi:hypothetical protein
MLNQVLKLQLHEKPNKIRNSQNTIFEPHGLQHRLAKPSARSDFLISETVQSRKLHPIGKVFSEFDLSFFVEKAPPSRQFPGNRTFLCWVQF